MPCPGNARWAPEQAQADIPTAKIDVTSKPPVGDISVVTLIRTDTTLDHSQEAEKVSRALHGKQIVSIEQHSRAPRITILVCRVAPQLSLYFGCARPGQGLELLSCVCVCLCVVSLCLVGRGLDPLGRGTAALSYTCYSA